MWIWVGGEGLGRVGGEEIIIRIYFIKKAPTFTKKKKKQLQNRLRSSENLIWGKYPQKERSSVLQWKGKKKMWKEFT